ncbi:MAG: aldehyde dehydrogenase family protein [Actinomycetota bacterium]
MRPFLLAGEWRDGARGLPVTNPYTGETIDEVALGTWDDLDAALGAAVNAFERTRKQNAGERAAVLAGAAAQIKARRDELIRMIVLEGGKPWKYAASEVDRAIGTMTFAAEEAKRLTGELVRLDTTETGRLGVARRFPLGPVLGITPFNFPLNLVAHKVAPALGAGNPIIVKPAPATPISSLLLGEIMLEAGAGDAMSVLPAANEDAERAVSDPRVHVLTFTGSTPVGWKLKSLAPKARVTLELGGNAAAIVEPDADLDHAAARITMGGFYQAGQSCVSVQRVLVHEQVYADFLDALLPKVQTVVTGDPMDPKTDVGPLIDAKALDRIGAWVKEAIAAGARALIGAGRDGPCYRPTVLVDVKPEMKVSCEEIFGPVITVQPYSSFDEAIAIADDSPFGLQAGLFTNDVQKVFRAHLELRVGGLIHNDVSAWRADQMPYGGVKASGVGKEGLRYAMEEMTEMRLLVLSGLDL